MATDDKHITNITLPDDIAVPLDELMPYAKARKLIKRSAHRNDLIRLILRAGIRQMLADRAKDEAAGLLPKKG